MDNFSDDDDLGLPSIYDGDDDEDEKDLWFMPYDEEADEPAPEAAFIFHHKDWIEAERNLAPVLAEANYMFGCLDERVRVNPGLKDRIARLEAVELAWLSGHRVGHDILNKHLVLADNQNERDQEAISETRWAYNRYMNNLRPLDDDIRDVLGRSRTDEETGLDLIRKTGGHTFQDLYDEWEEYIRDADGLHRLSQGALGFFSWQGIEVSGVGDFMEAAVVSQKLSAPRGRRGGLGFVPLALGGRGAFLRAGTIEQRLGTWYRLVENACHRALLDLNSVELFKQKSKEVDFKQTKAYGRIIEAFVSYPVVSVSSLTKTTHTHKDTALKYLDQMEDAGLITEITGQQRYRFWRIANS